MSWNDRYIGAEQAVIGCMLLDPERTLPEAVGRLEAEDFGSPEYRNVYSVCRDLYSQDKPVDVVTVLGKLGDEYKELLVRVSEALPTVRNYESYIEDLKELSRKTKAGVLAAELYSQLQGPSELVDCQETAARLCETLSETDGGNVVSAADGFLRFYLSKDKPKEYIRTGFYKLDKYTYIDRGDYIVVGGRPSSGKTAFTLQLMLNMARDHNVVYFSLETSADKLFDRLVSNYTGTPLGQIKTGDIADWTVIAGRADPFRKLRFHVVEAAGWTVAQIRAKAVQLKAEVVFIDYLSLIKAEGKSLYERVTNISMDLHTMAQRSKLTVIALSQLSREGRNEPDMSSLRESGQIEQDADVVLLLSLVDKDDPSSDRKLIIAKNKEGMTGALTFTFQGGYQRFIQTDKIHEAV